MNLRRTVAALLVLAGVLTVGCGGGMSGSGAGKTITVYSAAGLGPWYRSQFGKFTDETGIKVQLFEAGSGELVSRVNSRAIWEGLKDKPSAPPADLLVTLPPFIQKAARAGLLQASGADTTDISSTAVDPGGLYVPIVNTALCFIANPGAVPQPVTWNDLLRPELKGRLQYSTPGEAGDGTAFFLLLQHQMGKQSALDYLAKLEPNNVGPASSTATLQPKVSSGELLVANADVQLSLNSINNEGAKFNVFFPAMPDNSRTTVSLPFIAGVTAGSPRPDDAKKLLAFLLSDEAQKSLRSQSSGMPVRDSIATAPPGNTAAMTPTALLSGVKLWTPDWNTVLNNLEGDVAAYQKAIGK